MFLHNTEFYILYVVYCSYSLMCTVINVKEFSAVYCTVRICYSDNIILVG